jgi:tetratricopeptide (TPR) repeat protein
MKTLVLLFFLGTTAAFAQGSVKETDQLDFAQGLLTRGMYNMAIEQYQKFIAQYPHSPSLQEAYLSLGEGYFLSQDFSHAVDTFNQFKQLYPNSDQLPVSVLRLAQIDIQQQKYDDALKELASVDTQKQLKSDMLQSIDYYTAQAYSGKSDTANALDFYQKASQVQGAAAYTAYAYEQMAKIHTQTGKYPEALDAYSKALQSAQEDPIKDELTYRMAETQYLSGKYDDAIKSFAGLVDRSSAFAQDALANMLLAYFNLGQYDQLLSEYQKNTSSLKKDGSSFAAHFAAVTAYIELKKDDEANKLLDRMMAFPSLKPQDNAKIFVKKASILIQEKKYKDGLALLDAYSAQLPDDMDEALFLKGEGHYGLGEYDRAFTFFEDVYLNYPQSRFAKAALLGEGHSRRQAGRFKEAEVLFLKYYGTQDDPALKSDTLFDTITAAFKAGDTDSVISNGQEYLKAFPNGDKFSDVLFILVDNYDRKGQPQQAVDLLQGYLANNPSPQKPNSVYFLLGFNQQLLGNSDQALAAYTKVDMQKEDGKFYFGALKNMAIIYLNQKKEDEAKNFFDQLISKAAQNTLQIKTYAWVCNEYLKEQKYDDVLRIAAQAEKYFPSSDLQQIKYFEAEALRGLGRCDDANQDYDAVISSPGKNVYTASAQIGQGLCLAKANKYDEAKREFQQALDEHPDDYSVTAHARFEMANLEASQGHMDEALKLYLLIATIYDSDEFCSQSLLQAAKISENLKRNQDALKMYSEILDKYKNTPAAAQAKERVKVLK